MAFKDLFESWKVRSGKVKISGEANVSYDDLDTREIFQILQEIRSTSDKRDEKLAEYKEMLSDGITLSACELMAEDATQLDEGERKTIWVSCVENQDFADKMNIFLQEVVDIETLAYSLAFNVVVFGDAYLNTFFSDDEYKKVSTVGEYFEIEEPEKIAHVYRYGKPAGFYVGDKSRYTSRQMYDVILSERDFIHFIADRGINRDRIDVTTVSNSGEEVVKEYTIRYGSSFLEAARSYYKIMMLLNDILILSRLSRSQFYRLFGIEVGNSDSVETTKIVKEIRDAISSKQNLNIPEGKLSTYASPMSTGGNIYYTVRNGKGSVSANTIGGDVDVKSILDIDYFDDKYYGALKVPKQFLGQSEDMPGGLGDTTLTRLDIRYARTIKRLQKIMKSGVYDLIIWKCSLEDIVPPEFTIEMSKVTTADDDEKAAATESELDKIDRLVKILDEFSTGEEAVPVVDRKELLRYIVDKIYKDPGLSDLLFKDGGEDGQS